MAQVAFPVIGGIIGAFFGNPALGWTIGAALGALLFPPEVPDNVGPRLGDKTVTSSTYGVPIPIVYGTIRTAGNIIWAQEIQEVRHVEKVGKGSSATSETFTYYGNFALGLCEGIIDGVVRIWADGKLIYDITPPDTSDAGTVPLGTLFARAIVSKETLSFRLHTGSEDQLPDPLIESIEGTANTPAFRGLAYLVFEDMPLADYGNRIPNITVEVTKVGSDPLVTDDLLISSFGLATWFVDMQRRRAYAVGGGNLYIVDIDNLVLAETIPLSGLSTATISAVHAVLPNTGNLVMAGDIGSFTHVFVELQYGTWTEVYQTPDLGVEVVWTNQGSNTAFGVGGDEYAFIYTSANNHYIYRGGQTTAPPGIVVQNMGIQRETRATPKVNNGFTGGAWIIQSQLNGSDEDLMDFYDLEIPRNLSNILEASWPSSAEPKLVTTITSTDIDAAWTVFSEYGIFTDRTDGLPVIVAVGSTGTRRMFKLDAAGTVLWISDTLLITISGGERVQDSYVADGIYGWKNGTTAYKIDLSDGTVIFTSGAYSSSANNAVYDSRTRLVFGIKTTATWQRSYIDRLLGSPTTLDVIVSDLCSRVDLDAADYNVTELASLSVPGYMLARNGMSARAGIEGLIGVYQVDGAEIDDILEFNTRGRSVSHTITEQDFAIEKGDIPQGFEEVRMQVVDLPRELAISYMDPTNDYNNQTHRAKRISGPARTMQSSDKATMQVAAALDPTFAKQAAYKLLQAAWTERTTRTFHLPQEHIDWAPTDVVSVTLDDGRVARMRIVEQGIGRNMLVTVTALEEDILDAASDVGADTGSGIDVPTIRADYILRLIPLRSPLLRDGDDNGRVTSQWYFFMAPQVPVGDFSVGYLYKSDTGDAYELQATVTSQPTWGFATDALGDTAYPWQTDEVNSVNIKLQNGSLSSVTQEQVYGLANAAALIPIDGSDPEIIQFRDAVLEGDGSYTLSGLMRGRRGTEPQTGNHGDGGTFVLLSTTGGIMSNALMNVDADLLYKSIQGGQLLEAVAPTVIANPGNDLKPYSPVNFTAGDVWGNDIPLGWTRRTRIGVFPGAGPQPLNEDSELYDIDIYDSTGAVLLKSAVDLISPAYTFLAADQDATDIDGLFTNAISITDPSFQSIGSPAWTKSGTIANGSATVTRTGTRAMACHFVGWSSDGVAYQDLDVSAHATAIDAGSAMMRIRLWLASNINNTKDEGHLEMEFYNAGMAQQGSTQVGVSTIPNATADVWTQLRVAAAIPATTRTIRLKMVGNIKTGIGDPDDSRNNIVFDDADAHLADTPVSELQLQVYQKSGQVGRGFAGIENIEV